MSNRGRPSIAREITLEGAAIQDGIGGGRRSVEIALAAGEERFRIAQSHLEHYPDATKNTNGCGPASTTSICVVCTLGGIELQSSEKNQDL